MSVWRCTVPPWRMPLRSHRATAERIGRAKVCAGKDPLSGREIRFRKTRKTEVEAQIELGKLLELARAGDPRHMPAS